MKKVNTPNELPDCKIINTLIEKTNHKNDYDFDYIHLLNELRNEVSIQVSMINALFPEYTPHDEKYHLKRLFFVADQLLGNTLIESMNATELFLLSVSLYAHDWGMAVNDKEKEYIISGCKDIKSSEFNVLDDEFYRFEKYCKDKNIDKHNVELYYWQEYVRNTHAFRSGKRVRIFFEHYSNGIGDFAARICEGHWLDFDVIEDYISYPSQASVNREVINVKALTIYVRLIDLLDLGEDRTPYILWKFVAPRNIISQMEWKKHRALHAVTFPNYQLGRYIQVDGSTDDYNVYMSIMDLKRYIDEQFRHCSDVLNRMNDKCHRLDITHIDWRIQPRGFEPVLIQFEFDRNRMFDILSDEIYKSNPYIFLRELLQNSIDAIQMRLEILEKKELSFTPKIEVNIEDAADYFIIKITDNGIGMDEYIIKNYLSVAGKSYYRSVDFNKEGLNMDPISRFGIGVLSCFMISDYIEIMTHKDPHSTPKHEYFKISIPSKENYFKIEKNISVMDVGTTFKVFVKKNMLPFEDDGPIDFNITNYLKKTIGFVNFPITINEKNSKTLILSPNSETISNEVFKLSYDYPINHAFYPQSIENVKEYFIEEKYYLRSNLGLLNYDGCITFLVPKSDSIDIVNSGRSWPTRDVILFDYQCNIENVKIKWRDEWIDFDRYLYKKKKFEIPDISYKVYMDGILLSEITPPKISISDTKDINRRFNYSLGESFVTPSVIINIPKPKGMKIDLARTNIDSNEKWDIPIWKSFINYFKETKMQHILSLNCSERLMALCRLTTFYKLPVDIIINDLMDVLKFPIPSITKDAELIFFEFKEKREFINVLYDEFDDEFSKLIENHYTQSKKYNGILKLWGNNNSLVVLPKYSSLDKIPSSLVNMNYILNEFIRRHYYFYSIEFISSPLGMDYPIVKDTFKLRDLKLQTCRKFDLEKFDLEKFNFEKLDELELFEISKIIKKVFINFPSLVNFPKPYDDKFAYSVDYLNTSHHLTLWIVKLCLLMIKENQGDNISKKLIGKIIDMINDLGLFKDKYENIDLNILNLRLRDLFEIVTKHKFIEAEDFDVIDIQSFVDNSISMSAGKFRQKSDLKKYKKNKSIWGLPIIAKN